ncbi:hypothetical protein LCGC14_1469720 [marine sediment metagenome]|uniref:Uncharacterized protein n=1 Tax=marine sediment metagenome TaxID=412755 RepID=A0A0F9JYL7_9ZZZZ
MGQIKKIWFLGGWPVDKGVKEKKPKNRKKEKGRKQKCQ